MHGLWAVGDSASLTTRPLSLARLLAKQRYARSSYTLHFASEFE
jgi:hypothetical protein